MGVRMVKSVVSAVAGIDEGSWVPIEYSCEGEAEVSETTYRGRRLVVRRTRLVGSQQELWPNWRHFAFVTDLKGDAEQVDAFHRQHAVVELAIRDMKEGSGLEHLPSGHFFANSAWLLCAALAHNLVRWTASLGEFIISLRPIPVHPGDPPNFQRHPGGSSNGRTAAFGVADLGSNPSSPSHIEENFSVASFYPSAARGRQIRCQFLPFPPALFCRRD